MDEQTGHHISALHSKWNQQTKPAVLLIVPDTAVRLCKHGIGAIIDTGRRRLARETLEITTVLYPLGGTSYAPCWRATLALHSLWSEGRVMDQQQRCGNQTLYRDPHHLLQCK